MQRARVLQDDVVTAEDTVIGNWYWCPRENVVVIRVEKDSDAATPGDLAFATCFDLREREGDWVENREGQIMYVPYDYPLTKVMPDPPVVFRRCGK